VDKFGEIEAALHPLIRMKDGLLRWSTDGNPEIGLERLINQLEAQRQRMTALATQIGCTKTKDIEATVAALQNHLTTCSRLFSRLLSICAGSQVIVHFPMETEYEKRLDRLIDEFQVRREEERAQLDLVMSKARSFGYSGSDLNDAVDRIVALRTDEAHQTLSEQQHEDIMTMRAVHECERFALEKQLRRAQKTIDSLRSQIA
jgi:hypothetical protein